MKKTSIFKKHIRVLGLGSSFFMLSWFSISFFEPIVAALVVSGAGLAITYARYSKNVDLRTHLKMFEEAADKLSKGEKTDYIPPISLSSDEVLGSAHNSLIKFVTDNVEEVKKSKALIDIITTSISEPLIIIRANGKIKFANNSFLRIARRETLNDAPYERVRNKKLRTLLQDALIREDVVKKEITINEKSFRALSRPLFDGQKRFSGVVILFHDVTEIEIYQNLQREFFTNASHELKTPITAIKGCAEILLSGTVEGRMVNEFLTIIVKENLRLEKLVKDLFLVNRFDTNQIDLEKEMLDLDFMLKEVINQTETIAELKNQPIEYVSCESVKYKGDAVRIEQCFLNLLTNAIHYSPVETRIEITLEKTNSEITIKFKDHGIGIPKKDLPHIFERFYRVDRSRGRHSGGTGLGLSIVKSTIEAHGGKVSVESEVEVGTTFSILLPI